MNTTYILVMELFDVICDEVTSHIQSGRRIEALTLLRKTKTARREHIHRSTQVLGLQAMAQEVAKLQSEMGFHVNPPLAPDNPGGGDTMPPTPTGE